MKPLPLFLLYILPVHLCMAEDAQAARIRQQIESPMTQKVTLSDGQWRKILTPGQFQVLRQAKTEAPYKNAYWNNHEKGIYLCAACGNELFGSDTKFESRTGWPSFYAPLARDKVTVTTDTSAGMTRDEVRCARCGSHLGHVFNDGPAPTHLRYCLNSVALKFVRRCITTALLTAVGASSTGGLAALALKKLGWKSKRNHQTEETGGEQNANRNNGTRKNRC